MALPLVGHVTKSQPRKKSFKQKLSERRRKHFPAVRKAAGIDGYFKQVDYLSTTLVLKKSELLRELWQLQVGLTFTTYLKRRLKQQNLSAREGKRHLGKFINALNSRKLAVTRIDAFWELLQIAEGPSHCNRLLEEKINQIFGPFEVNSVRTFYLLFQVSIVRKEKFPLAEFRQ